MMRNVKKLISMLVLAAFVQSGFAAQPPMLDDSMPVDDNQLPVDESSMVQPMQKKMLAPAMDDMEPAPVVMQEPMQQPVQEPVMAQPVESMDFVAQPRESTEAERASDESDQTDQGNQGGLSGGEIAGIAVGATAALAAGAGAAFAYNRSRSQSAPPRLGSTQIPTPPVGSKYAKPLPSPAPEKPSALMERLSKQGVVSQSPLTATEKMGQRMQMPIQRPELEEAPPRPARASLGRVTPFNPAAVDQPLSKQEKKYLNEAYVGGTTEEKQQTFKTQMATPGENAPGTKSNFPAAKRYPDPWAQESTKQQPRKSFGFGRGR